MTIHRVTQHMMMDRSYTSLQAGLTRLAKTQEQLATGRVINRPSDSPTDATAAMRIRASLADQKQYLRNTDDGLGWLGQIDTTLTSVSAQLRRVKELALEGANAASGAQARSALAVEVEQIRESLVNAANAEYLGRPVFGGVTAGGTAYGPDGAFVGVTGNVTRTIAHGVKVSVNVDGPAVFGPPDGPNVFKDLAEVADSLRSGDMTTLRGKLDDLDTDLARVGSALGDVGARFNRLERAARAAEDLTLSLTSSLAEVENVDLARATMDLRMQEVAYQAGLAATARLVQPSLSDFLR